MTIRLELDEREAELLHQALMLILQASSPDLMKQVGWEDAEGITATALVQHIFDCEDLELLSEIALLTAPLKCIEESQLSLNYSQHNISCCEFQNENSVFDFSSNGHDSTQFSHPDHQEKLGENVVKLDKFRKQR